MTYQLDDQDRGVVTLLADNILATEEDDDTIDVLDAYVLDRIAETGDDHPEMKTVAAVTDRIYDLRIATHQAVIDKLKEQRKTDPVIKGGNS